MVQYIIQKKKLLNLLKKEKISFIKSLTTEEIKELGYKYTEFDNKDYKYKDNNGIEYLIRDKKTIAIGKGIEFYLNEWY